MMLVLLAWMLAAGDRHVLIFDGRSPDQLACDTTLRRMPDGSWVMVMLGGGDREPLPENDIFLTRSGDEGRTWSKPAALGLKQDRSRALVPTELMVHGGRATLFFANHDGHFNDWTAWQSTSTDSGRTWGKPRPIHPHIHRSTFVRNHIVNRKGEIVIPFQHYESQNGPVNPRNGVMISRDGGETYEIHGWIRISADDAYRGFAENTIAELRNGSLVMLIRADKLGGVLFRADSSDGGRTWSQAYATGIPNPGSKAVLYGLGGDCVALLHNPDPKFRRPLALWVST
ncbi:MAG: sialidase family protein, partial [Bryobacteraceae bacterium]|nr:sialidase family protein [Bryobacteraceae bacterium]